MRVAKWGNGLAVRLPAAVVKALDLKPGDQIHVHVIGDRSFALEKAPGATELLVRLRKFRGRLPAGKTVAWDDATAYLEARAQGAKVRRPVARKLGR